jgi:hypothetical protein
MGPKHAKNAREKASFSNAKKGAFPTSPADANTTVRKAIFRRTLLDVYAPPRGSTITDEKGRENGRPASRTRRRPSRLSRLHPAVLRLEMPSDDVSEAIATPKDGRGNRRERRESRVDGQHRPAVAASNAANSRAAAAAADWGVSPHHSDTGSDHPNARRHRTTTQSTPSQRSKVIAKGWDTVAKIKLGPL